MEDTPIVATGYMCGTDITCEMREPRMLGYCHISPNEAHAKTWKCAEECGIVEVEIRVKRWVVEPLAMLPGKNGTKG